MINCRLFPTQNEILSIPNNCFCQWPFKRNCSLVFSCFVDSLQLLSAVAGSRAGHFEKWPSIKELAHQKMRLEILLEAHAKVNFGPTNNKWGQWETRLNATPRITHAKAQIRLQRRCCERNIAGNLVMRKTNHVGRRNRHAILYEPNAWRLMRENISRKLNRVPDSKIVRGATG